MAQRLAVRLHAPGAVGVPGQPDFVQQRVGAFHVVLGVVGRHPVLEPGPGGADRGHPGNRLAEVQLVADLLAVDRQRQRLAEAQVVEQLALDRILVGVVEHHAEGEGAAIAGPEMGAVAARRLVAAVRGSVGDVHELVLGPVELAGHRLGRHHVGRVLDDQHLHAVGVGKLVAGRVHLPVEGVAAPETYPRLGFLQHPGIGGGQLGEAMRNRSRAGVSAVGMVSREGVHPGLVTFFLGDTCSVVVVFEVVLAQVVFRGEGTAARPAALGGVVVRCGEGVLDGVAVRPPVSASVPRPAGNGRVARGSPR